MACSSREVLVGVLGLLAGVASCGGQQAQDSVADAVRPMGQAEAAAVQGTAGTLGEHKSTGPDRRAAASSTVGAAAAGIGSSTAAGAGSSTLEPGGAGTGASSLSGSAGPLAGASAAQAGTSAAPSAQVAGSAAAASSAGAIAGATATQTDGAGTGAAEAGMGGAAEPAHPTGGGAGQATVGTGEEPSRPSTWRVELLGDSITETTCASQLVFDRLRADGHTDFDLVGTKRNEQGCGVDAPDRDCEGHSGYLVTELAPGAAKAAELTAWCEADRADVVLMHFGTNDAWNSGVPIADVIRAYSAVVGALRAAQPHVVLLVAQIIPMRPDGCADCESRVRAINDQIPMWAAAESTSESPIYVVDQWTGFDVDADTRDGVHPNLSGAQKMADVWVQALYAHNVF